MKKNIGAKWRENLQPADRSGEQWHKCGQEVYDRRAKGESWEHIGRSFGRYSRWAKLQAQAYAKSMDLPILDDVSEIRAAQQKAPGCSAERH